MRCARGLHAVLDLAGGEQLPRRDLLAVAPERVVTELDDLTVVDRLHHRAADAVEQRDLGPDDPFRSTVRIAARDREVGVHDRADARREQALGGDAVEVAMVDDGDVTPADAIGEFFRSVAHPRHPDHAQLRPVRA